MQMNIFKKSVTTLNIESDSIRLVQIKGRKVRKYAEAPVPQGLIKNTDIKDPAAVAGIIKSSFKQNKVYRRGVRVAVNSFRSVPRFITLPRLKAGKFKEAIMWAARREMPVSLDTLYVSWQVLERNDTEQRVFILGTPREVLDRLKLTLKLAGVHPKVIDSKPLAIGRLMDRNKGIGIDLENETISIILQVQNSPVVMQTVVIQPENTEIADRTKILTDDLFRILEHYNNSHPEQQINSDIPVSLTGGIVTDDVVTDVKQSTGREVNIPQPEIIMPDGMSAAKYAVNIGLYLREIKTGRRNRKKQAVHQLRPDIRKAKSFKP